MNTPYRIVLADSNPASANDFRAELEEQADFVIAAAVTCASCSFNAVSRQKADLVILNLSMPGHRTLELVKDLTVLNAGLKFLIVSSHPQPLETASVLRSGAHGCVAGSSSSAIKMDAVRQVLAGHHYFSSETMPQHSASTSSSRGTMPLHWLHATATL